ncbi:hypothetical protein IR073_06590 [Gemella sp. 19428wG2_WT2a]|nr:hypothetical protein [Gemella sp. 19428wG2_WT2a]TFU57702.1 hypothetical protein E4T67_06515 [Gemella sp. WT2a]
MTYSEYINLLNKAIKHLENYEYDKAKKAIEKADVTGYTYHYIMCAIDYIDARTAIKKINEEIKYWEEIKENDD